MNIRKQLTGEIRDTLPRILAAIHRPDTRMHLWKKMVVLKGIETG
ncbi:MAG TPA: hypothetical protein VHO70_00010 [Chitinispirillaceae bacterium]|nr:hypothetical protein [Chitinispirillaceae bacterium]